MVFHQPLLVPVIFAALFFTNAQSRDDSTSCSQLCGSTRPPVPYPFGFSDGCKIRLNCSEAGDIKIADFTVRNFTSGHLLLHFPPKCNRSLEAISQLFGDNYQPTWRNSLLLHNCSAPMNGCVISTTGLENQFQLQFKGCEASSTSRNDSLISCYPQDYGGFEAMNRTKLKKCQGLFSSIALNLDQNTSLNSDVSLDFQTMELGWWLNQHCRCAKNANCTSVLLPDGTNGSRCQCLEGFVGDGFQDGNGCRRVSDCNASRSMSDKCGGTTRVGVLIAGIIAGASLISTMALIYHCIRRRSAMKKQMSAKRLLSEATGSFRVPFYPYREIERATNSFSEKQRLGIGAYGTVYAGKLNNDEWVAIKKLRYRDTDGIEQVMNEIKLLSSVSHPNLVRLLGCCIEKGEQILVYEYMPNGTLSQHLQRERGKGLPWTVRLTIATETAHAIAHLHSAMNPPIYHRDIKSSNILLNYNFNSKVADFGLSRLGMTDDSHISTAPQGTPGYLDPQYHQNFHLSDKSDVYSFGVVLVEIITAMKVVDFSRAHTEINLAALAMERIGKGRVDEIIDPFLEPNRDAWTLSSIHKVAELAFRCLAFHRDMRPSMIEVADELEQIRQSAWAPSEDNNICMASSSVASSCSSPYNGSEKSIGGTISKKVVGIGSRRLVVPQRAVDKQEVVLVRECSPVSVQDPWLSEQSSPSTNSLLSNVVR